MNAAAPSRTIEIRHGARFAAWWPVAAWTALPFVAIALSRDRFTSSMLTAAALQGVFVVSWDLLAGTAGQPSLGHALAFGGGAYAAAFLSRRAGLPPVMLAAAAALAGAMLGGVQGRLTRRLTPVFVALVTLGTVEGARRLSATWTAPIVRGLGSAQTSVPIPAFPGDGAAGVFASAVFGAAVLVVAALARSRFGLALRAAAGEEREAASLGFDAPRLRLAAFILAGAIAGVAGALSAQLSGHATPDLLSWRITLFAPAAAILGGTGTIVGPAAAAYAMTIAAQWFDVPPAVQLPAFAAIVVAAGLRDPEHFLRSDFRWTGRPPAERRSP